MLTSRRAVPTAAIVTGLWLSACDLAENRSPPERADHQAAITSTGNRSPAIATGAGKAHTVTLDKYSLLIDGQRIYLWAGEFHYWRLPSPDLWRDILEKLKAAGFNAVNIYFHWGYHSPAPGVYDFTGIRDVDALLDMAGEVGLYVIARPGPYINAETDSGGLPAWLNRLAGQKRSPDPTYLAHVDDWLTQIDAILARHQLTSGTGTIILDQVENEFTDTSDAGRAYMQHLIDKFRADGITVPLTGNHWNSFNTGTVGVLDVDGWDSYPQGFNCSNPARWSEVPDLSWLRDLLADRPLFFPEYQGGAFDFWGGPGYPNCRQLTGPDFERVFYSTNVAVGSTMQSFYMTYGGTSWGYLPFPGVYTSYDYGAAIAESRQLTAKYDQQKLFGTFLAAAAPIRKTESLPAPTQTNPAVWIRGRMNPDEGTQLYVLRHVDGGSTSTEQTHLSLDLTSGASGDFYPTVPQEPGTAITIDGRDAKVLLANYPFGGGQRLVYSTSQLLTHTTLDGVDVAVLYAPAGEDGETVLRYSSQPTVDVLSGSAVATWDGSRGDLRLNYSHAGLAKLLITGGGQPDLVLLLAERGVAAQFWSFDTAAGTVLARGPYLVRQATVLHDRLALRGDTAADTTLEIYAPRAVREVTWNGSELRTRGAVDPVNGPLTAPLPGPEPATLPELRWRYRFETPEADPAFDDFHWTLADHLVSQNEEASGFPPLLGADEYGFHHGHSWYRGHFTAHGTETAIFLNASTGNSTGQYAAWLNGSYLGTGNGGTIFPIPSSALVPGQDSEVSVLVANMGHDQGSGKVQRGLVSARLYGSMATIAWRVQGNLGGEDPIDPVRGTMNVGGLHGERAGWHLPGFPDGDWQEVGLPHSDSQPGVAWYRSGFDLHLPAGQDVPIALRLSDDDADPARRYRVQIYLNGWNLGLYVNDVGPQHDFVLPAGLLRTDGENALALAVWSSDASGGLGTVSLVAQGNYRGGVPVAAVPSPRYAPDQYVERPAPAHLTLTGPDQMQRGDTSRVAATLSVPRDRQQVSGGTLRLSAPTGWQIAGDAAVPVGPLGPGQSIAVQWMVASPPGDQPSTTMLVARADLDVQGQVGRVDAGKTIAVPPPAPSGDLFVSDLPFQATNGWGPVERDTSNGEQAAGDGRPITLNGTVHARGLGAHAPGDITVYLGHNCTSFTSVVGIDDEAGASGSVRFHVLVDNREVASTGAVTGTSTPVSLDVDITGADWLDLVLDDAGNGNGLDHADWADAMVHCN